MEIDNTFWQKMMIKIQSFTHSLNQNPQTHIFLVNFNTQQKYKGVPCPTNKGVSYTNLVSHLAVTLKIDYYYYYYYNREAIGALWKIVV